MDENNRKDLDDGAKDFYVECYSDPQNIPGDEEDCENEVYFECPSEPQNVKNYEEETKDLLKYAQIAVIDGDHLERTLKKEFSDGHTIGKTNAFDHDGRSTMLEENDHRLTEDFKQDNLHGGSVEYIDIITTDLDQNDLITNRSPHGYNISNDVEHMDSLASDLNERYQETNDITDEEASTHSSINYQAAFAIYDDGNTIDDNDDDDKDSKYDADERKHITTVDEAIQTTYACEEIPTATCGHHTESANSRWSDLENVNYCYGDDDTAVDDFSYACFDNQEKETTDEKNLANKKTQDENKVEGGEIVLYFGRYDDYFNRRSNLSIDHDYSECLANIEDSDEDVDYSNDEDDDELVDYKVFFGNDEEENGEWTIGKEDEDYEKIQLNKENRTNEWSSIGNGNECLLFQTYNVEEGDTDDEKKEDDKQQKENKHVSGSPSDHKQYPHDQYERDDECPPGLNSYDENIDGLNEKVWRMNDGRLTCEENVEEQAPSLQSVNLAINSRQRNKIPRDVVESIYTISDTNRTKFEHNLSTEIEHHSSRSKKVILCYNEKETNNKNQRNDFLCPSLIEQKRSPRKSRFLKVENQDFKTRLFTLPEKMNRTTFSRKNQRQQIRTTQEENYIATRHKLTNKDRFIGRNRERFSQNVEKTTDTRHMPHRTAKISNSACHGNIRNQINEEAKTNKLKKSFCRKEDAKQISKTTILGSFREENGRQVQQNSNDVKDSRECKLSDARYQGSRKVKTVKQEQNLEELSSKSNTHYPGNNRHISKLEDRNIKDTVKIVSTSSGHQSRKLWQRDAGKSHRGTEGSSIVKLEEKTKNHSSSTQYEASNGIQIGAYNRNSSDWKRISLCLFILLVNVISANSTDSAIFWTQATVPALFGGNLTLTCFILNDGDSRKSLYWHREPYDLLAMENFPSDIAKFKLTIENTDNITVYDLTIMNLSISDLDRWYRCSYGNDWHQKTLNLSKNMFISRPKEEDIQKTTLLVEKVLSVTMTVTNIYPVPVCELKNKQQPIAINETSVSDAGGLFNIEYKFYILPCFEHATFSCFLANESFLRESFEGTGTVDECDQNDDYSELLSMAIIGTLIVGTSFIILGIILRWICKENKDKEKENKQDDAKEVLNGVITEN